MNRFSLAGKVALVTGGAQGIGFGIGCALGRFFKPAECRKNE